MYKELKDLIQAQEYLKEFRDGYDNPKKVPLARVLITDAEKHAIILKKLEDIKEKIPEWRKSPYMTVRHPMRDQYGHEMGKAFTSLEMQEREHRELYLADVERIVEHYLRDSNLITELKEINRILGNVEDLFRTAETRETLVQRDMRLHLDKLPSTIGNMYDNLEGIVKNLKKIYEYEKLMDERSMDNRM